MILPNDGNDPASRKYTPLGQSDTTSGGHTASFLVDNDLPLRLRGSKRSKRSIANLCALVAIALVPVGSIVIWGSLGTRQSEELEWFSSAPIGGRFTQSQAKAIDLVCGAVLAPLLLVIFNYIWFTSARVAAVNELDKSVTTLQTLSVASATTTGSYNIFDIWQLTIRSRSPRLVLMGFLIICAAVANTALTNIIAYEAYTLDTPSADIQLQYLRDDQTQGQKYVDNTVADLYEFDQTQTATFSEQFSGMLTRVSIMNARAVLNGSEYYLVNTTAASLNVLEGTIVELPNVPAIKYAIQCQAEAPASPMVYQMGVKKVSMTMTLNSTERMPSTLINAYYSGQIETMQSSYNDRYDFIGFPSGIQTNESYVGFTTSFDLTNDTREMKFGKFTPVVVNMSETDADFTGTKTTMSWWGMRCWMNQTPGTVNLHRAPNATWSARHYKWDDAQSYVTTDWALSNLQMALDYKAPGTTLPGIGSALVWNSDQTSSPTARIDYETTALNLLYAECETKRMIFETAATNHSRARPEYFYAATAFEQTQFYRITYVPFILFAGELAVLLATTICLGLTLRTWRSESGRTMRKVDVLRLVVDSVSGLHGDRAFEDIRSSSNGEIDHWAGTYSIRYRSRRGMDQDRPEIYLSRTSKEQ